MIITHKRFASIDIARTHYRDELDEAIDNIRDRYYAKGIFILDEYRLTLEQAIAFKKNIYPVPVIIAAYAQALNVSPAMAVEYIFAAKAVLDKMLEVTCRARLIGKAAILAATTNVQMQAAIDTVLAELSSELPSIPV